MKIAAYLEKLLIACIFTCCVQAVTAQNLNIRGRVYDEDSLVMPGAMIWIKQGVMCSTNGFFDFKYSQDSLRVSVQYPGFLPYEKKIPRNYEGHWNIYLESDPELDKHIIHFGPRYGIKSGYLFDKNGMPIAGVVVTSKGNHGLTRHDISRHDGFFETRDEGSKYYTDGYTELSILVDGHKPFKYTFQSTGKTSSLIEHDGLFIVLIFDR